MPVLLTVLIDESLCEKFPSIFCSYSCEDKDAGGCAEIIHFILTLYPKEFLQELRHHSSEINHSILLIWNLFMRILRSVGIEILWNIPEKLHHVSNCRGEISLWTHLLEHISQFSAESFSESIWSDILVSPPRCRTDIDDCDCDLTSSQSQLLTTSHLLDERRGFYHLTLFLTSTHSFDTGTISVDQIIPRFIHEAEYQNFSTTRECVVSSPFPHFLEMKYTHEYNMSLTFSSIPLLNSDNHPRYSLSSPIHLRGKLMKSFNSHRPGVESAYTRSIISQLTHTLYPIKRQRQRSHLHEKDILQLLAFAAMMKSCL